MEWWSTAFLQPSRRPAHCCARAGNALGRAFKGSSYYRKHMTLSRRARTGSCTPPARKGSGPCPQCSWRRRASAPRCSCAATAPPPVASKATAGIADLRCKASSTCQGWPFPVPYQAVEHAPCNAMVRQVCNLLSSWRPTRSIVAGFTTEHSGAGHCRALLPVTPRAACLALPAAMSCSTREK